MADTPKVQLAGAALGAGTFVAIGVVVAALLTGWFMFTQTVHGDEFAVRQVYFGPGQGVQTDLIGSGFQLVIPGYERLHMFPRDMQILDMNTTDESGGSTSLDEDYTRADAIRIQTSDGFQVTVDVTVMYRIVDPYMVITRVGPGRLYEENVVHKFADQFLRKSFGPLKAEDFYLDYRRMAAEEVAREDLSAELALWGLQVWGVLVRDYAYDERFQHQIEAKKIEDQRKFKNQAETLRETRQQEKFGKVADMQRQIEEMRGEGDLAIRRIRADGERYYRSEVAEGDRAVAIAEADAARMQRDALESAGASAVVGLEMAEALKGTQLIVVSTTGPGAVNPLDLDSMVKGW